tara:strand:+ start:1396 stop:1665 length:270 start_codon:yes stop_codon:yes gene_type:complete
MENDDYGLGSNTQDALADKMYERQTAIRTECERLDDEAVKRIITTHKKIPWPRRAASLTFSTVFPLGKGWERIERYSAARDTLKERAET